MLLDVHEVDENWQNLLEIEYSRNAINTLKNTRFSLCKIMHAQLRDILTWILGTDSALYRQVMLSPRKHALVEMEESLLFRTFEEYALQACAHQSDELIAQRNNHFTNPVIIKETQGWIQHVGFAAGNEALRKKIICICVLVRDFDDIRKFVERKWAQSIVVDATAVVGGSINYGINMAQAHVSRIRKLQKHASVIVMNIPYFCNEMNSSPWDGRYETWKNAIWHHTVRRVIMEARLILCGEIIQHGHDVCATVNALHDFLKQIRGSLPYTAKDLYEWYNKDDALVGHDCNMQMVCDVYNYKSVTMTTDNTQMPSLNNCEQLSLVTLEHLRVVVIFCSNMVCKVHPVLLQNVLGVDLNALKMLVIIYDRIRGKTAVEQQKILAAIGRVKKSFVKLHCGSCEMEKCLRMYVYLRHLQDPEYTARLMSHLVSERVFSVREDACVLFASWLCRKRSLAGQDSCLSSAIIEWGGQDLADFCLRSNSYLRGLQPVVNEIVMTEFDDALLNDASSLLHPFLYKEFFDEHAFSGPFIYADTQLVSE